MRVVLIRLLTVNYRLARVVQQATPNCPHAAARMDLKPNKQQVPFKQVRLVFTEAHRLHGLRQCSGVLVGVAAAAVGRYSRRKFHALCPNG